MKKQKIFFATIFLSLIMCFACEEEEARGPLVVDSTIPNPITTVEVENLPGGAKLTYSVPTEEDALYVEARFERNGEEVTTRSSIFKDNVIIEGLNDTNPQEVSLIVVDRSNNESDPFSVTITPEKSPLQHLFETFEMIPDFGGPRVLYNNQFDIQFELLLYVILNGQRVYQTSDFINDGQSLFSIFRGFDPVNTTFGVEAVDRWNNTTPLFQSDITPFVEVQLDRFLMEGVELVNDEPTAFGWVLGNLFNGTSQGSGFHTSQGSSGVLVPPYTEAFHMFTIDMGQLAKLSRVKFWLRQGDCCGTPFGHGDPRFYEIWGIDQIPADNGASFDGWTRLIENGEVIKPSGAALGSNSADDLSAAASGVEALVPIDAPPVRYIRFVNQRNWSGTKFVHVMEYEFFGEPQ